jgi:hypothetical protein
MEISVRKERPINFLMGLEETAFCDSMGILVLSFSITFLENFDIMFQNFRLGTVAQACDPSYLGD